MNPALIEARGIKFYRSFTENLLEKRDHNNSCGEDESNS
jgi:hypothetical protein